jgi:hypothetical protein
MRYEIIENGQPVNTIEADESFMSANFQPGSYVLSEYQTPEPTPIVPEPPKVAVTMRQARLALLGAGLLDDVSAAINALPSPQKEAAQIEWEYSQEVQRHNGFVSQLAPILGLSEAQLDSLFATAKNL